MSKTKHTPRTFTDFEYFEYSSGVRRPVTWMQIRCKIDGKQKTIANFSGGEGNTVTKAEAVSIVNILNSHADLLEALKAVEWSVPETTNDVVMFKCPQCMAFRVDGHMPNCMLRAAIAKAKGE